MTLIPGYSFPLLPPWIFTILKFVFIILLLFFIVLLNRHKPLSNILLSFASFKLDVNESYYVYKCDCFFLHLMKLICIHMCCCGSFIVIALCALIHPTILLSIDKFFRCYKKYLTYISWYTLQELLRGIHLRM